jgi:hypothetical protein
MIIFKLFDRFKINTSDAIVINYWVAASLSFGLDASGVSFQGAIHEPWFFHAIFMGILFNAGTGYLNNAPSTYATGNEFYNNILTNSKLIMNILI